MDGILIIDKQLVVEERIPVKISVNNDRLEYADLKWILHVEITVSRWSQLKNLLFPLKDASKDFVNSCIPFAFSQIEKVMRYCQDELLFVFTLFKFLISRLVSFIQLITVTLNHPPNPFLN